MYKQIPNGKKITIQGLDCWTPPVGWGTHSISGELAEVEIMKRSPHKKDQYWERTIIPEDFEADVEEEEDEASRRNDPLYSNPRLDGIREREWHRRLYGVWFYNNGEPVYLTGLMYFFLNYWELDTGYPDFRIIDLEYYYFWQYAVEDPLCYGVIEVCKRRNGKTFRGGCMLYESASLVSKSHCGMTQKKLEDARDEIYMKAILPQFQTLPSFFRPTYDTSGGEAPKGGLRFFKTSQKGKNALKAFRDKSKKDLQSKITYRDTKVKSYDGTKLYRGMFDESGKIEIDVIERHGVLKKCLENDRREIIGKMLVTSTVEEIGIKFRFEALWNWSDQNSRTKTGKTKSGLYRFFQPADRSAARDIYGYPFQAQVRAEILSERESLEDDQGDLIDFIRKEPLSADEAFAVANKDCHFNLPKLNKWRSEISIMDRLTERGSLSWKNNIRFSSIVWEKNSTGRWEMPAGFKFDGSKIVNNVQTVGSSHKPMNTTKFVLGLDPYDHSQVEDDGRKSLAAALALQKHNPMEPNDPFNKAFILKYHSRQKTSPLMYEDILMTCWYLGCKLLYESQKPGVGNYFIANNCRDFLIRIPGYKDYGIPSTTENKASLLYATEEYIENHIEKVYFISLVDDWIKFDILKTQKFDLSMAAGWTLIADVSIVSRDSEKLKPITAYIKKHKISKRA